MQAAAAASDIHDAEVLLANLPEVVRQAIGAPMPFPDRHFAVFIIFSWNFPLFWTSLQTYMAAGWGRRVIILDNSPDHRVLNDPCECAPPLRRNTLNLSRSPYPASQCASRAILCTGCSTLALATGPHQARAIG